MPDQGNMLTDMEFEEQLKSMGDRQLLEFTARQVYDHGRRIQCIERQNKRMIGIFGAAGTIIGSIIATIIAYFRS